MDNQNQKDIFERLSEKSGWSEKTDNLQQRFDVEDIGTPTDLAFILTSKGPEKITMKITFLDGGSGFQQDGFNPPDLPELNLDEKEKVDAILAKKKSLWMFSIGNSELIRYDLSKGYKELDKQEIFKRVEGDITPAKIMTRRDGNVAMIYYKNPSFGFSDDIFVLGIDMKKEAVLSAQWFGLSPVGNRHESRNTMGRMMPDIEFDFINKSLFDFGHLKSGDNVSQGLENLVKHNHITLSFHEQKGDKKSHWSFSLDPLDGYGHSTSFDIDAQTGELSEPLTMHILPNPHVETEIPTFEGFEPFISPVRDEPAFDMPKLSGQSTHLDKKDREYIDKVFKLRGHTLWEKGLAGLEDHFEIQRERDDKRFSLFVLSRTPDRMSTTLTVDKNANIGYRELVIPDGHELNTLELENVDTILKDTKSLTMRLPWSHELVTFDLSLGYAGLLTQNLRAEYRDKLSQNNLLTRRYEDFAVLYYLYKGFTPGTFCIWVNLKKNEFSGANWIDLPMLGGSFVPIKKETKMVSKSSSQENLIPENWDESSIVPDPLNIGKKQTKLKMPKLSKALLTFSDEDRAYINEHLASQVNVYGNDGLALLEKDFEINRMPSDNAYELELTLKMFPHLKSHMHIEDALFESYTKALHLPRVDTLTKEQMHTLDDILVKLGKLWMSTPSNYEVKVYDLSQGYKGLLEQNLQPYDSNVKSSIKVNLGKIGDKAIVCYENSSLLENPFCLWVDLKTQEFLNAQWFMIPLEPNLWISPKKIAFLDKSLKASKEAYLSGQNSLQELFEFNQLGLSESEEVWWIHLRPKGGGSASLGFSIDKKSGKLGVPISGH